MKSETIYYCARLKTAPVTIYMSSNAMDTQHYVDEHPECVLVEM